MDWTPLSHSNFTAKLALVSDPMGTQAGYGGAERLVFSAFSALSKQNPTVKIHTPLVDYQQFSDPAFRSAMTPSAIQRWPFIKSHVAWAYPLLPWAMEQINVQYAETVVSFHHFAAKAIIPHPEAFHLCYCHSPARYLWDQQWLYNQQSSWIDRQGLQLLGPWLRAWDVTTAQRVDQFLANSSYTARRIERYYRRDAAIVYPPVECHRFYHQPSQGYWLMAGRLMPYKRFDIAIQVFNQLKQPLTIVGHGPAYNDLKTMAGPTITFVGGVSDDRYAQLLSQASGLIYPGLEDFGMVMAEAQAAGKPVLALAKGGALDIVIPGQTGLLLETPTLHDWMEGVKTIEAASWSAETIQGLAQRFDESVFQRQLIDWVYQAQTSPSRPRAGETSTV